MRKLQGFTRALFIISAGLWTSSVTLHASSSFFSKGNKQETKKESFDAMAILNKIPDLIALGVQAVALNKEIKNLKNQLIKDLTALNEAADNKKIVPAVTLLEDASRPLFKLANLLHETMDNLKEARLPGGIAASESALKLKALAMMIEDALAVVRKSIMAQHEIAKAQQEGRPAQITPIQPVELPADLELEL